MRVFWVVDDGTGTNQKGHELEIDDEKIEGMDEIELNDYIDVALHDAFTHKVYPRLTGTEG